MPCMACAQEMGSGDGDRVHPQAASAQDPARIAWLAQLAWLARLVLMLVLECKFG